MPLDNEREEELPSCDISQLEAWTQCGADDVYDDLCMYIEKKV